VWQVSDRIPRVVAGLDWLTSIASGAAGGAVALGGQILLHKIAHEGEERRRAEERSEQAAQEILEIVDEARRRYEFHGAQSPLPSYDEVSEIVGRLRKASLYIIDENVRGWLDHAASALAHLRTLAQMGEGFPLDVTWNVQQTVQNMLGAMLRVEKIPDDVEGKLGQYADAIDEHGQQMVRKIAAMQHEVERPAEG
jgi:hypothetical protein